MAMTPKTVPEAGKKAKERFVLKWRNVYSGETGYVGRIKAKYFENTYDAAAARTFPSIRAAENAIAKLREMGEAENNFFEIAREEAAE